MSIHKSLKSRDLRARGARRGTAMLEAIIVISVFILFFVGMIYFRKLYQEQLTIMRLSRAAAVGYAMNGCNGTPTENISKDLLGTSIVVDATGDPSGSTHVGSTGGTNPKVGKKGGNPVGGALGGTGLDGDKIASDTLSTTASAGSPESALFKATVRSTSFMTCGEPHKAGDASDMLTYVKDLFL
jgi:hypothetical protein